MLEMRLKILSLNVRGLGSPTKVNSLCHELEVLNFDIVLLQETHFSCLKQAKVFEQSWRGKCYWSFGIGKSAGVAVLLLPHFSGSVQRFLFDSDGRILSLLFTFGPLSKLNVINIYAPNLVFNLVISLPRRLINCWRLKLSTTLLINFNPIIFCPQIKIVSPL